MNNLVFSQTRGALLSATTALFLVGCAGENEIKTYRVAKEDSHTQQAHQHASEASASAGAMAPRASIPHLHADTPEGWQEIAPEKMRVASFRITADGGKTAEVAVIPLPGVSNIELRSVNLWREELGLPEISSDQLKEQTEPVQVGDTQGLLVALSGNRPGETNQSAGILGAVAERGNITWFIKLAGNRDLVNSQKNNFVSYLKSLEFHEGSHGEPASGVRQVAQADPDEKPVSTNSEKVPEGAGKPNFTIPENWKSKPPGPMITSAYNVEAEGGAAEVTISKFPGDVGGMVANIQRWRGQLGLNPGSAEEARKSAEMLEIDGKKDAYMVDLSGTNVRSGKTARMISVGVPYQGETWFFKLMGDDAVVAKEKDKFVQFVKSAF